jgi:hypothetical protein
VLALTKLAIAVDTYQNVEVQQINVHIPLVSLAPMIGVLEVPPLAEKIKKYKAVFMNIVKQVSQP